MAGKKTFRILNGFGNIQHIVLTGLNDEQATQLDIIRTEQVATNAALQRHEKRITALEEKGTGYKIRDAEE